MDRSFGVTSAEGAPQPPVEDDVGVVHPASRDGQFAWSEHKDARLGAALAYYSVFSLGPGFLLGEVDVLLPDEVPDADGTSRPLPTWPSDKGGVR